MANYKEQTVTGAKWTRSNRVVIQNPYQGVPTIYFNEEEITALSDGLKHSRPNGGLTKEFSDPMGEFPLIHPETGVQIGTATYQEVYVLLHSLYIALANERDQSGTQE